MKKTIVCVLMAGFLCLILSTGMSQAAYPVFTDVGNHWAKAYITRLAAAGHISGFPGATFRPNEVMTRAGFVTALISCLGVKPGDTATDSFGDIAGHWARAHINEAVKRGILVPSEYPSGLVPNGAIKRSEAAAMLVRALGKEPDNSALPFKDRATVARSMYSGYIKTAYNEKLILGYSDGEFKPFRDVTRAQACVMLCNFLDKLGTGTSTYPVVSGSGLSTLLIGDASWSIGSAPIYFKIGTNNVRVNSVTVSSDRITVNQFYSLPLNTSIDNLQIDVYNNHYVVSKLGTNGTNLVVTPASAKLTSLTKGGYKYDSEFIKLYLGTSNSKYYLSDADVVDKYTIKVGGKTYDLTSDKVTIALNDQFYAVERVVFGSGDTTLELSETSPVVVDGPDMDDIATIFVGSSTLDLDDIDSLDFIINGKKYDLSQVSIDASGNFTVDDDETYSPSQVIMVTDDDRYQVKKVQMHDGKFIFYCSESDIDDWVRIDDKYYDSSEVDIIMDGDIYPLDKVTVVKRNVLRIDGRQYSLDSSFKCRLDGTVYDIDEIDYDTSMETVTMEVSKATGYYGASQPSEYVFYYNGKVYQRGANDDVNIYADGGWRDFDDILIPDPAHFYYDGSTYDLIGARVRIDDVEFKVKDTAWYGLSEELDVYLNKS
ncbi:MAG: S-layer homology domain-containing protein [Syntrophomonadaceae bacterium]|nr:S-layer homology domain-containing protein [Syntrophomonadaceae bacterium]